MNAKDFERLLANIRLLNSENRPVAALLETCKAYANVPGLPRRSEVQSVETLLEDIFKLYPCQALRLRMEIQL